MKAVKFAGLILASAVLIGGAATVLAAQGGQEDPLITLSYLEQVVAPQLEKEVDAAVEKNAQELRAQLDIAITSYENRVAQALASAGATAFAPYDLTQGKVHTAAAGHELLLVSGDAYAVGALVDTTSGESVKAGDKLTPGHLYVTAEADAGFRAQGSVSLLGR